MFKNLKGSWKGLPDKKIWIDFVAAALSIPVLVTVIIANINNLRQNKQADTQKNTNPTVVYITQKPTVSTAPTDTIALEPTAMPEVRSTSSICDLDPQSYDLTFPKESETVTDNPVCVVLEPTSNGNCETKWSYRINSGSWSSYTDSPICLSSLPAGNIKLDVRTKNTVSGREETYTRNFIYRKENQISPTLTQPSITPIPS